MKYVSLPDFLTKEQIQQALDIWTDTQSAKEIAAKVIQPNLTEINRKLGQENDALYLSYACTYVFQQIRDKNDR